MTDSEIDPLNAYHNQVLRDELQQYRNSGSRCISEVNLTFANVTSRLDILCLTPSDVVQGAEIKTGNDPRLLLAQSFVDTHAILGAGVTSPDVKIGQLGLARNVPLPAIPIWVVWVRAPGEQKRYLLARADPLN